MTTINVKLLNQVACAILDEPTKFSMDTFTDLDDRSPCGTVACIAGHAVAIAAKFPSLRELHECNIARMVGDRVFDIEVEAKNALGVSGAAYIRLFYAPCWPDAFADAYWWFAKTPEERADVGFWRIQHFIATEGRE